MNKEKKKLILFLVYIVLVFTVIGAAIYSFLNHNTDKITEEATVPNEESSTPSLTGNTIYSTQENEHHEEHLESETTDEAEGHQHTESKSIFDSPNEPHQFPFIIKKPTTIDNISLPSLMTDIFYANNGYVFLLAEKQEMQFFDPHTSKLLALENDIKSVQYSRNGIDILFQKTIDGISDIYTFDYINNNTGFRHLARAEYPFTNFGIFGEMFYLTSADESESSALYLRDSVASQGELFIPLPRYDLIETNDRFLIGYNNATQTLEARNLEAQLLFQSSPVKGDHAELIDLKIKTESSDSLSYLAIFKLDELGLEKTTIHNGVAIEGFTDVYQVEWVSPDYLIGNEAGFAETLFLYNVKSGERYDLDFGVRSMSYDTEDSVIYYTKYEQSEIFKIELKK